MNGTDTTDAKDSEDTNEPEQKRVKEGEGPGEGDEAKDAEGTEGDEAKDAEGAEGKKEGKENENDAESAVVTAKDANNAKRTKGDTNIIRKSKTLVVGNWLQHLRMPEAVEKGTVGRAPFLLKSLMLQAETKMLQHAHSLEKQWHQCFHKKAGTKKFVSEASPTEKRVPINFFLGGNISLQPSKQSYKLCEFGAHSLFVDGSEDCGFPYLGWAVPLTTDEGEANMELSTVSDTLSVGTGRAKVSINVEFHVLALKVDAPIEDTGHVAMARAKFPWELNTKADAAKKTKARSYTDGVNACLDGAGPAAPDPAPEGTGGERGAKRAKRTTESKNSGKDKKLKTTAALTALGQLSFLFEDCVDKKNGDVLLEY